MNTDGINVLHVADRDDVSGGIAHHLVFDFLPAADVALNQHLVHAGQPESVGQNLTQHILIVSDSAARSSECIRRTQHYRITDFLRKPDAMLQAVNDL